MKKCFLFIGLIFFSIGPIFSSVRAASLKFDNTSVDVSSGGTFSIGVVVDAGSNGINSTDIYITFDSSILQAQSVTEGTFFPTVTSNITSGTVFIAGLVDDVNSSKTGSGTVATVTFQGLKDGTTTLAFNCGSSTIVQDDINATNILDCNQNGIATIIVGAGSGAGNRVVPTSLPQTGVYENLINWAVPGAVLFIIGGAVKLLL